MTERVKNLIIGAGASGTCCALMLAQRGEQSLLVEAGDRILKKLLATGNGRCNLSNNEVTPARYNAPEFVREALTRFTPDDCKEFMKKLGLATRCEDGRIYPYSMSSAGVVTLFLAQLQRYGIKTAVSAKVESIRKTGDTFEVVAGGKHYNCSNVIFATGSNATSGMDSLLLLKALGHESTKKVPSVAQIPTDAFRGLSGVRTFARASLVCEGKKVVTKDGELLFKDNAMSGMLAFELSSQYARLVREGKECTFEIDFIPDFTHEQAAELIKQADCGAESALCGLLHAALARFILKKTGADLSQNIDKVAQKAVKLIKNFTVQPNGIADIKNAQVVCGGLSLSQFDQRTMQSKKVKGLYAIGEALDVDGDCGGFNLHWAWASANACAEAIVKKC